MAALAAVNLLLGAACLAAAGTLPRGDALGDALTIGGLVCLAAAFVLTAAAREETP